MFAGIICISIDYYNIVHRRYAYHILIILVYNVYIMYYNQGQCYGDLLHTGNFFDATNNIRPFSEKCQGQKLLDIICTKNNGFD